MSRLASFLMNRYQPNREDLLINTEWGIPAHQLSEDEARNSGRLLFQNRWVYPSEQRKLITQCRVYAAIRLSAALVFFLGLIELIAVCLTQTSSPSTWRLLAGLAFGGIFYFFIARGLWKFKRWAWKLVLYKYVGMPTLVICIMLFVFIENWISTGRLFNPHDPIHEIIAISLIGLYAFVLLIFFGIALLNRTARKIFRKHQ